jgi:hypothetical protein
MEPIVLSMSAIQTYQRCRKKFELSYVLGMEDKDLQKSEALEKGISFHQYMKDYYFKKPQEMEQDGPLFQVAEEYWKRKGMPFLGQVMSYGDKYAIDHPFLVPHPAYKNVWLRCSFDLVFRDGNIIVIRDYKTFSKAPNFDIDLDFQGRMYIALATKLWGPGNYKFEHEMVRIEAPGSTHGTKPVKYWTEEECYFRHSMILSSEETEDDWDEILYLVDKILDHIKPKMGKERYDRAPQKGGGYMDCSKCNVKNLCIAQKQNNLDEGTLKILSKPHPVIWGMDGLQRPA